jgi:hypothetical protein
LRAIAPPMIPSPAIPTVVLISNCSLPVDFD